MARQENFNKNFQQKFSLPVWDSSLLFSMYCASPLIRSPSEIIFLLDLIKCHNSLEVNSRLNLVETTVTYYLSGTCRSELYKLSITYHLTYKALAPKII